MPEKLVKKNTIGSPEAFAEVVKQMQKEHGDGMFLGTQLGERLYHDIGYPEINDFLGGGLAVGTVTKISGAESCGKTAFALLAAASYAGLHIPEEQRRGVLYIDADQSLGQEDLVRAGIDPGRILVKQTPIMEDAFEAAFGACSPHFGLVVVDSTASLVPRSEVEASEDMEKISSVAPFAGLMSRKLSIFVRLLKAHNMAAIFVSQARAKIGATRFENPHSYGKGGHMLAGIAGQHIVFYRSIIKEGKERSFVGISSRLVYDKNKLGTPNKSTVVIAIPGYPMLPASHLKRVQAEINGGMGRKKLDRPLMIEGEAPIEAEVLQEEGDGPI